MEQHAHTEEHAHEATGHGHSHGGDGHDHDHGGGLVGWFRGALPHSHRIEDKTDDELEGSERGVWALKLSLIGLGITAILQLSVVLISGSVALLADTIHNFGDAATSIPLWIAFALARHGASKRLTYGYGKTEDVAGGVIVLIIFISACVAAYESVQKLIHPNTITHIGWVAVAAVIGFLGNELVGVFRIRVGKEIGSAALVADGYHSRVDGFTSLAVLIGVGWCLGGCADPRPADRHRHHDRHPLHRQGRLPRGAAAHDRRDRAGDGGRDRRHRQPRSGRRGCVPRAGALDRPQDRERSADRCRIGHVGRTSARDWPRGRASDRSRGAARAGYRRGRRAER